MWHRRLKLVGRAAAQTAVKLPPKHAALTTRERLHILSHTLNIILMILTKLHCQIFLKSYIKMGVQFY
jgi:hypothetical protein